MSTPEVQFISEENGQPCHKYLVEGKEIPGLSYILSSNGFLRYDRVNKQVMEAARERGDAAHYATRLYDEDNPKYCALIDDWQAEALTMPLDEWTRSRLVGWIKFRNDFKFNPLVVEQPTAHCWNGMLYGMTPDRVGQSSLGLAVFEIKTTAEVEPSHAIQTAFQIQPFRTNGEQIKRFCVQLGENEYKINEFTDRKDEQIAAAILAATWWKWERGIR